MSFDVLAIYERRIQSEAQSLADKILNGQMPNHEAYKAKCEERRALLRTVEILKEAIAQVVREELDG